VLLGLGLLVLLLALSRGSAWGWTAPGTAGAFAAAAALLAAFVLAERRAAQPLVDLDLVVRRPFLSANLCAFTFGFGFFIAVFVVPQLAAAPPSTGYGLGLSTTGIGLILLPTGLASVAGGWVGGRIVDRLGPRALLAAGATCGMGGYVFLALVHGSSVALGAGSGALGLAWGLILTAIASVVVRRAAPDATGVAVAVNVVTRNTAVTLGVQVAFTIVAGAEVAEGFPVEAAYARAFVLGAAGAACLLLASILMPRHGPARA
jgi:predicted MFS family arabinose efflux permease